MRTSESFPPFGGLLPYMWPLCAFLDFEAMILTSACDPHLQHILAKNLREARTADTRWWESRSRNLKWGARGIFKTTPNGCKDSVVLVFLSWPQHQGWCRQFWVNVLWVFVNVHLTDASELKLSRPNTVIILTYWIDPYIIIGGLAQQFRYSY